MSHLMDRKCINGAYTEKLFCQIHFFEFGGAQGENFFVYAPLMAIFI